jgi:hypothetical protein
MMQISSATSGYFEERYGRIRILTDPQQWLIRTVSSCSQKGLSIALLFFNFIIFEKCCGSTLVTMWTGIQLLTSMCIRIQEKNLSRSWSDLYVTKVEFFKKNIPPIGSRP